MNSDKELDYEFVKHEYQVNKPNGDIDWVEVADLPEQVAFKWINKNYPNCEISLFRTTTK